MDVRCTNVFQYAVLVGGIISAYSVSRQHMVVRFKVMNFPQ